MSYEQHDPYGSGFYYFSIALYLTEHPEILLLIVKDSHEHGEKAKSGSAIDG